MDMSDNQALDRIKQDVAIQRRRFVHEGHAEFPAMRIFRPGREILSHLEVPYKGVNVLEDTESARA